MAVGLLWGWGGSVGLEGICGADVGLLWDGCGVAMGLGVGLEGILWGWGGDSVGLGGGFYGVGGDSVGLGSILWG